MTLWLVGGLDPTGGAGILRDFCTAQACAPNLATRTVVTALTEQGAGRPARSEVIPASLLAQQIRQLPTPIAIKVGLVPDALVPTVVELLGVHKVPVVVDPVLRASDGGALGATAEGLQPLLQLATVVTPNRPEAAALAKMEPSSSELLFALRRVVPEAAVLLKDGHGSDPHQVCDRLMIGETIEEFARPRIAGSDPRGTGCALATAIACGLALGWSVELAASRGVIWLDGQRRQEVIAGDGQVVLPVGGPSLAATLPMY